MRTPRLVRHLRPVVGRILFAGDLSIGVQCRLLLVRNTPRPRPGVDRGGMELLASGIYLRPWDCLPVRTRVFESTWRGNREWLGLFGTDDFIRWASTDFSILQTHPLTPGWPLAWTTLSTVGPVPTATGPATAAATATSIATPTATTVEPMATGTISTGAIAGIAVAGVAGLILLMAAIVLVWKMRRRTRHRTTEREQADPPEYRKAEMDATTARFEMASENKAGQLPNPAELPADSTPFELPDSSRPPPSAVSHPSGDTVTRTVATACQSPRPNSPEAEKEHTSLAGLDPGGTDKLAPTIAETVPDRSEEKGLLQILTAGRRARESPEDSRRVLGSEAVMV